jgi:hypothetical protein
MNTKYIFPIYRGGDLYLRRRRLIGTIFSTGQNEPGGLRWEKYR